MLGYFSLHLVFTLGEKHSFWEFHSNSEFNLDPVSAKRRRHCSGGAERAYLGSWEILFHLLMDAGAGKEVLFI